VVAPGSPGYHEPDPSFPPTAPAPLGCCLVLALLALFWAGVVVLLAHVAQY